MTGERPVEERAIDGPDVPQGLALGEMAAEVERCFNCGCVAVTPSDLAPALVALDAEVVTTRRVIPADEFFAARPGSSTVLAPEELVTEIRVPAPRPGRLAAYEKFRLRGAIDFPILGVACALELVDGLVHDARLVFGAAAPFPVRAAAAEAYLEGRALTPETIAEASRLSTTGGMALSANHYKLQVAQGLVRRTLAHLAE